MNSGNISKKGIKSIASFDNIKRDYFLLKLIDIMKKNKYLEINKNLQKRLKLAINDYKEYSQLYSDIEIELTIKRIKSFREVKK